MKIRSTLIAVVIASFPAFASATMIDGDITFVGSFTPTGGSGGLADATGINFTGDSFTVLGANGAYASTGITAGDTGSIYDFTFDSWSGPELLWEIGSFDFFMETMNVSLTVSDATTVELSLSGTGTIYHTNYDATPGYWNITANQNGTLFSFSGGATSPIDRVQVPEPATLSLLGAGLLGMGFFGRRRRRS
jgi:hypothetical protein